MHVTSQGAFTNPAVMAAVQLTDSVAAQLGVPAERVQIMRDADRAELRRAFLNGAMELSGDSISAILNPSPREGAERMAVAALVIREQELA